MICVKYKKNVISSIYYHSNKNTVVGFGVFFVDIWLPKPTTVIFITGIITRTCYVYYTYIWYRSFSVVGRKKPCNSATHCKGQHLKGVSCKPCFAVSVVSGRGQTSKSRTDRKNPQAKSKKYWYIVLTLKNGPTEPNLGGQGSAEDGVSGGGKKKNPGGRSISWDKGFGPHGRNQTLCLN